MAGQRDHFLVSLPARQQGLDITKPPEWGHHIRSGGFFSSIGTHQALRSAILACPEGTRPHLWRSSQGRFSVVDKQLVNQVKGVRDSFSLFVRGSRTKSDRIFRPWRFADFFASSFSSPPLSPAYWRGKRKTTRPLTGRRWVFGGSWLGKEVDRRAQWLVSSRKQHLGTWGRFLATVQRPHFRRFGPTWVETYPQDRVRRPFVCGFPRRRSPPACRTLGAATRDSPPRG
jgi:hypothetical protein